MASGRTCKAFLPFLVRCYIGQWASHSEGCRLDPLGGNDVGKINTLRPVFIYWIPLITDTARPEVPIRISRQ